MRARVPRSRVTHERWLISYADFITLLFGLFVVMFAFASSGPKAHKQVSQAIQSGFDSMAVLPSSSTVQTQTPMAPVAVEAKTMDVARVKADLEHMRQQISQELSKQIEAHVITVRMDRDGLVISLREAGFFASGSAQPRPEAREALLKISDSLGDTPYNLRIEGHTDNVPVHTAEFDSNWELSAARATHIARLMLEYGSISPEQVAVAGYGEFHPVATNATPEGRAQNRRVDLVVLPRVNLDFSLPEPSHPQGEWRKITDGDAR